MKNVKQTHLMPREIGHLKYVPLDCFPGFDGYYVDRFNDIYSVRRKSEPLAPWVNKFPSGATVERVTLFDNDGKRRQLSRRKVLIATLGLSEYERREADRANMVAILEKEERDRKKWQEREDKAKYWAGLRDRLDFPLNAFKDKQTRADVVKLHKQKDALGDLF